MEIAIAIVSHRYNKFKWYATVGIVVLMILLNIVSEFGYFSVLPQNPIVYMLIVLAICMCGSFGFYFYSRYLFFHAKEKKFIERTDNYVVFEPEERKQMKTAKTLCIVFWGIVVLGIVLRFIATIVMLASM